MNLEKALLVRDRVRKSLIGTQFFQHKDDWRIRDVIVANSCNVKEIYLHIWDSGISNEMAISFVQNSRRDFDVYIISHQWNWGSGDLYIKRYILDSDFKP